MPTEYTRLVAALKALTQGETGNIKTLPMAEDEWNTRPDTVSYGTVRYDFEVESLNGDNRKVARAHEGSVDLYSLQRDGSGWPALIENTLTDHCDSAWYMNMRAYERDTGLWHWEWAFQVED